MKKIFFYDTMIGRVGIAAEENAVTELILPLSGEKPSGKQETGSEDLKRAGQKEAEIAETPLIRLAFMQLSEYLAGKRKEFSLPLEPEGTEFQKKVWRALAEIPYGTTRSYREIAKETGNEKAARAVGMANNKNPIPIFIPCHRVISSDGSMAGYYGGIAMKKKLLDLEKGKADWGKGRIYARRGHDMSIGYACLTIGVPGTGMRSCIMKNADDEKLLEVTAHNLDSLEKIIEYNIENGIRLFRISSDLIPFGSSPVNQTGWSRIFASRFQEIGKKIRDGGMRVSMHPGQYTVLNSPDEGVVSRAVRDLEYHAEVLDSLGMDAEHKIILHIGGVYRDKESAAGRFMENYRKLPDQVKSRLVLENDDKSYSMAEVLEIAEALGAPAVFDNLHNRLNPGSRMESEEYWIERCRQTWKKADGRQKIHYSQQNPFKNAGSHSETIRIQEFMEFYRRLENKEIDIMLEVKDKNLSAVKCINCTMQKTDIRRLESEWGRYKYLVLEKSQEDYLEIRRLFRSSYGHENPAGQEADPGGIAISFYSIVERAMEREASTGNFVNAAQHVWGYFKNTASEKEKKKFMEELAAYESGSIAGARVKAGLRKLAVKYQESYLLDSYYFL